MYNFQQEGRSICTVTNILRPQLLTDSSNSLLSDSALTVVLALQVKCTVEKRIIMENPILLYCLKYHLSFLHSTIPKACMMDHVTPPCPFRSLGYIKTCPLFRLSLTHPLFLPRKKKKKKGIGSQMKTRLPLIEGGLLGGKTGLI